MVIIGHFYSAWLLLFPALGFIHRFASRGGLGVDLFFLLSGFILSYVYPATHQRFGIREYGKFVWFRLARVYPNHVATIGMLAVLLVASRYFKFQFGGDYPLNALPYELTMTHAWISMHYTHWNYPSWSISAEWFAYLAIFPTCWHLARRFRLQGAAMIGICYGALIVYCVLDGRHMFPKHQALYRVGCEFVAGSALFRAYQARCGLVGLCHRHASTLFVALLAVLAMLPVASPVVDSMAILLFPLLLLGLTAEETMIAKFFSTEVALFMGRVSYAVYMSHAISQRLLDSFLPTASYAHASVAVRSGVLLANLVLILGVASALYALVEVPSRNHMRVMAQWFRERSPGGPGHA
jgi:peptidoglycan/LPS O-acetylase OafA/YrhL